MMDAELNVTYLNFGGHVDLSKYRYLYFVVMFTAYILIICSNCIIICVIWLHRNLHEPMYIFIAALSVNSVLFSTVIYPKLLIDFVSETQIISYSACLFQSFVFYSLGGSDFLLLAAMAYDRYMSICKPLHYLSVMGKNTVCILLVVAWLLPACEITVVILIYANKRLCKFTIRGIFCNSLSDLYCWIPTALEMYSFFLFMNVIIAPVLFILFSYTKIFTIAHSNNEVRKKAAETCLPHLLVLLCFSCLCAYDVIAVRLGTMLSQTAHYIMTIQIILYNPLLNPIIYGLKMKEISKHLRGLFCGERLK